MVEVLRYDGSVAFALPETDLVLGEWASLIRMWDIPYSLRYVGDEFVFLQSFNDARLTKGDINEGQFIDALRQINEFITNALDNYPMFITVHAVMVRLLALSYAGVAEFQIDPRLTEEGRKIVEGAIVELESYSVKETRRIAAIGRELLQAYNMATGYTGARF